MFCKKVTIKSRKYIHCKKIIDGDGSETDNVILELNSEGKIIEKKNHINPKGISDDIKKISGIVCPGFINVHCHLELSYLHQRTKPHQGLISFLEEVTAMKKQAIDEAFILKEIEDNDKKMYQNGIVAVGDVCNSNHTIKTKKKSPIYYHNFIELIGLNDNHAESIFKNGEKLKQNFGNLRSSLSPHAPYSTSLTLIQKIAKENDNQKSPFSIHLQESAEENNFLQDGKGGFFKFYNKLGIDISFFEKKSKNSLEVLLPYLPSKANTLLVHNTFMKENEINNLKTIENIYCGICPSANLYIENCLPKMKTFKPLIKKICIGTDSLSSNDSLDIFKEMKIIQNYFPNYTVNNLIQMATLNGAKCLAIDHQFGSLTKGKKPGLNEILINKAGQLQSYNKIYI